MFVLGTPSLHQHDDLILMNILFELLDHRLLTSRRKPRTAPSLAASTRSPNPRIERSKHSSLYNLRARAVIQMKGFGFQLLQLSSK